LQGNAVTFPAFQAPTALNINFCVKFENHLILLILFAHLFVKVPQPTGSEGILSVFDSSYHLLTTCLITQKNRHPV